MTAKTEIKCDGCGRDITYTGNCEDWRLVLSNEAMGSRGGFVTAMAKYRPVSHTHHFCGMTCLDYWRDRERFRNELNTAWYDKWKTEKGTKLGPGSWSIPCAPDEVTSARDLEIDAQVAERFPLKHAKP
jgi:hypothetical protein